MSWGPMLSSAPGREIRANPALSTMGLPQAVFRSPRSTT